MRITKRGADSGRSVLLLHGSPSASSEFAPLIDALALTHQCWVADFPGYLGAPGVPGLNLTTLEEAVAARGLNRLAVVGFSGGAYRAVALAVRAKVDVTQLVLLGGFAGLDADEAKGLADLSAQLKPLESWPDALIEVAADRWLAPGRLQRHPSDRELVCHMLESAAPKVVAQELAEFAVAADLRSQLQRLDIPVLARCGALDAAVSPAHTRAFAARKRGQAQVVPDTGHALFIEDGPQTVASIAAALMHPT